MKKIEEEVDGIRTSYGEVDGDNARTQLLTEK